MKSKYVTMALVCLVLILGLVACERPASTAPKSAATATTEGSFPVPGQTDDVMGQLESFATQTAIALQGGPVATAAAPSPIAAADQPAATAQATPEATAAAAAESPAAPAAAVVTAVIPTPGRPATWTLQKGEHPYCLARRYDVNPAEMLRLSGLGGETVFTPGTVFKIPKSGDFPGARALRSHPTTYTVTGGDTIYSVACLFGDVDPSGIIAANGLTEPYKLAAGTTIQIP